MAEDEFPTYADLTQTSAWKKGAAPTRISMAVDPVELSDDSRYTESAVLGVGGMGKVLLARDQRIGRDIALKLLHPERSEDEQRQRFLREAQVQGQLEHPAIVPVYDIDQRPDGSTFFTMRRVHGHTLAQIIADLREGKPEAKARYTQRELLQAFATVCLAIDYAHSRGVVHRDLKPSNIMLGDFGEVYVLDWGLARILDPFNAEGVEGERLSLPGAVMGTPLYMAPEQMADPAVGPVADVFSLGAILFEILTLERLRNPRAVFVPPDARPSVRYPDRFVAPELETICVRATELDMKTRFQTARALQEALARYLEGDREQESRKRQAASHGDRARTAITAAEQAGSNSEEHRTQAMRELLRALALDPTDRENLATFAKIMQTPPNDTPPEIEQQIRRYDAAVILLGTKFSMIAMVSWFAFLPIIFALGLRRPDYLITAAVPTSAAALLSFFAWKKRIVSRPHQLAIISIMAIAAMTLSRMLGPVVVVPTVLATWSVVMQAHPDGSMRKVSLALGAIGVTLPLALELVGILPSSYLFEGNRLTILPQMHDLPKTMTLVLLTIANVSICILPATFIARLRADLSVLQRRDLVRTWHFRRLGDDLVRAAT